MQHLLKHSVLSIEHRNVFISYLMAIIIMKRKRLLSYCRSAVNGVVPVASRPGAVYSARQQPAGTTPWNLAQTRIHRKEQSDIDTLLDTDHRAFRKRLCSTSDIPPSARRCRACCDRDTHWWWDRKVRVARSPTGSIPAIIITAITRPIIRGRVCPARGLGRETYPVPEQLYR